MAYHQCYPSPTMKPASPKNKLWKGRERSEQPSSICLGPSSFRSTEDLFLLSGHVSPSLYFSWLPSVLEISKNPPPTLSVEICCVHVCLCLFLVVIVSLLHLLILPFFKLRHRWINDELLKKELAGSKGISRRTAHKWMEKLGFRWSRHQKCVYVDGHNRPDVVIARRKYVKTLLALRKKTSL